MALAAVEEGPQDHLGGAGSSDQGVENPSASEEKCDAERAEAACVGTGWSLAAATGVSERAVAIAPGWLAMWAAPGPAGAATGTTAAEAEGSWDCCVGPVTHQDRAAAAEAASVGWPVEAGPERT